MTNQPTQVFSAARDRRKAECPPCEKIDDLETMFRQHVAEHNVFEASLTENTRLTQEIANSTKELVDLVKGIKGLRSMLVWIAGPLAGIYTVVELVKALS